MEISLIHGLSGALSSMIATGILHPLESIRVKMQAEFSNVYFLKYAKKVYCEEGLKGIYSGFTSNVINLALSYSMYFFSYKWIKNFVIRKKKAFGVLDDVYATFLASIIVIVFNTPLWTINTRLCKDKSKSFREVFYQILYNEGPGAFFKGAGLSVVLSINPVIQYSFYEYLKKRLQLKDWIGYFVIGAVAKFVATVFTYPILTLRTRFQLNEGENKSLLNEFINVLKNDMKTNKKEFLALYNGFFSKAVQTVFNSAIILSLHETITGLLIRKLQRKNAVLIG